MEFFIKKLEKMKGNDVVIVNKTVFKHLVQVLGNRAKLVGDPRRDVYDYAVVRKTNGGKHTLNLCAWQDQHGGRPASRRC